VPHRRTLATDILSFARSDAAFASQSASAWPSWLRLAAYAGSRGTGHPKPPVLEVLSQGFVGAQQFRRRRSVGTRRRRESLRTIGAWSKPTRLKLSTRPDSSMPPLAPNAV